MSDTEFPLAALLERMFRGEISPAEAAAEASARRRMHPSPGPVHVPEEAYSLFPEHQHTLLREFVRHLKGGAGA